MSTTAIPEHTVLNRGVAALGRFASDFATSCKGHALLAAIVALLGVADLAFVASHASRFDVVTMIGSLVLVVSTLPVFLLAIVVMRAINLFVYVKPEHPVQALLIDLRDRIFNARRIAIGLPVLLLFFVFANIFAHIKANIPVLAPYDWDVTFMELDRWLHFGVHPWEWLQPVLGFPAVTLLINFVYNVWFMVLWVVWVWFGFGQRSSVLRTRFLLTFFLSWIIGGNLLAIVFSSAGPCFYFLLGHGAEPYGALMTYLQQAGETYTIWALETQNMLWEDYARATDGSGISAMPSMHNASAFLFALAGARVNRAYGWGFSIFAAFIFIGSIHLGWHYAIDAYLGFAVTYLVWIVMEPAARWWESQAWARSYAAVAETVIASAPKTATGEHA